MKAQEGLAAWSANKNVDIKNKLKFSRSTGDGSILSHYFKPSVRVFQVPLNINSRSTDGDVRVPS